MKFAKELEHQLVPEWRAKYLDYKLGKKKIKAVQRALRSAQSSSPLTPRRRQNPLPTPRDNAPQYSYLNRDSPVLHRAGQDAKGNSVEQPATVSEPPPTTARDFAVTPGTGTGGNGPSSGYLTTPLYRARSRISSNSNDAFETSPLLYDDDVSARDSNNNNDNRRQLTRYGSIIGSPPRDSSRSIRGRGPPSLDLPGPALRTTTSQKSTSNLGAEGSNEGQPGSKDGAKGSGRATLFSHRSPLSLRHRSIFHPQRMNSSPQISITKDNSRPMIRRLFSLGNASMQMPGEFPMAAYKDVDVRQGEFFNFLDLELEKVEDFYKTKEDDATKRLEVLRQQLHIMRDRRLEEIIQARTSKSSQGGQGEGKGGNGFLANPKDSILDKLDETVQTIKHGKIGERSKALERLHFGYPAMATQTDEHEPWNRDYVRKIKHSNISYHTARRKLKVAIQEYYRGLELLKSYALLNQKAFRKINKKYDKAVNARPSLRYMNEKVNTSYFVTSDVIDGHIRTVEDLYARYFEGGNHKVAAGKLRAKSARHGDYTGVVFRNGIYLAAGAVFGVQGLVYAGQIIEGSDEIGLVTNASFLMQIYGGYFLMLMLMLMFVLDCRLWSKAKVNYAFIFEFDNRSFLDWRELAEIPCFLLFLLGFFIWINFSQYGTEDMFIYYPVVLVGLTIILLVNPLPVLYPRSRQWFLTANWRLFFSGLYPVEFRDFFLGDMFCSLTYAMGNVSLFFCLYAHLLPNDIGFSNPSQCNSSHSRVLGFLTTLPGIWRAFQCLRRYKDTRNAFPHLVNCGKYVMTICFYMSLSLWRIDQTFQLKALFIFFATLNAVYCSTWDLVMDWSLLDPYSYPRLLRDHLAFKSTWIYYAAMIIDPILRFNWIFYAIYGNNIQHSALLSFFVSFSEVCRRGMWTIFRVENEHCTNVGRFRASRDVPLPYKIKSPAEDRIMEAGEQNVTGGRDQAYTDAETDEDEEQAAREAEQRRQGVSISPSLSRTRSTAVDMNTRQQTPEDGLTVRQRAARRHTLGDSSPMFRAMSYVGSLLHTAHAQDFERKRKDDARADVGGAGRKDEESDSDIDDTGTDADDEGTDQDVEIAAEIGAWGGVGDSGGSSAGEEGSQNKDKGKEEVFTFKPKRELQDEEEGDAADGPNQESSDDYISPRALTPVPSRGRLTGSEENVAEEAGATGSSGEGKKPIR